MADNPVNRVARDLPDPLATFHVGDMPQRGIPPDLTEEEEASLAAERATLRVPPSWPPEPPEEEAEAEGPHGGRPRSGHPTSMGSPEGPHGGRPRSGHPTSMGSPEPGPAPKPSTTSSRTSSSTTTG